MKILNPGANISSPNISSPPPISWATKPKRSPADFINHSPLEHVDDPGSPSKSRQLVPIFINPDHIPVLQEALRCVSASDPDHWHQQPKLELREDSMISDAGNIQTVLYIGTPNSQQLESHQDVSNLPEDEVLASSISRLFMSSPTIGRLASVTPTVIPMEPSTPTSKNSGLTPLGMRTAPVIISGKSSLATPRKRRYYAVLVGKCAGVYYDEWRVLFFSFFPVCSHHDLFLPGKMLSPLSVMSLMLGLKDFQLTTWQRSSTVMRNKKTRLELSGTPATTRNMGLLKKQFSN